MENRLSKILKGKKTDSPALWMMRQAGRYLPEYRQVREQAGSFWTLCFTPHLAAEVTLQPIRRFDYDAAIIFSDILVIPKALGQTVEFAPNHGPLLEPLDWQTITQFSKWTQFEQILAPVYDAISQTRESLAPAKDLIGFAGSPWTIATYMMDGGKGNEFSLSRQSLKTIDNLQPLLEILTYSISLHLINQVQAGANVLQIFDSWASLVPVDLREDILFKPLNQIITTVRQRVGDIPIIYFGRGISESYTMLAQKKLNIAVGIDQHANLMELARLLPAEIPLQGNLDPEILVEGGEKLKTAIAQILEVAKNRSFVFNLGHGILPHTPISHVETVCELVRQGR
ncbi:MAG: uroporphyrinogen decarboxylase [Candidatus Paracaedibacteraceae bacterium]|nr:uroporphyrinogen decarboxylase [Candidatus Paracaedibacteraceae bacterium]